MKRPRSVQIVAGLADAADRLGVFVAGASFVGWLISEQFAFWNALFGVVGGLLIMLAGIAVKAMLDWEDVS